MLDLPFDFFSLVIALVALILAFKAFNQAAALRARLDVMERQASAAAPQPVPPPLIAHEAPIAPAAASEIRTETADEAAAPPIQPAAPPPLPDTPAAVPSSARPRL
jgi:hypothetical protein